MRSLSHVSPIAVLVLADLVEKTGENRTELGKKLVGDLPSFKKMSEDITVSAKKELNVSPGPVKTTTKAADLAGRSLHTLLTKKAQIPRAAMPWMKAVSKAKGVKGRILPQAPQGSEQPLHQRPTTSFATPGGAPELTPKSIKSMSQMVGGKLVRTKFK